MNIAIVILNWNGKAWLEKFLPSVITHSGSHPIYVADNGSTDDSVAWLTANHSAVKIITMATNTGYAGGYNEALQYINESIACLLNSDIEVTPGWLDTIPQRFIHNPQLAGLQPKIRDYNRKDYFEYAGAAGGFLDKLAYPYCRGRVFDRLERDTGQYNDRPDIDWASGAALFIRLDAFKKVGGFDTSYFAHQEEIDLCWRLRLSGYTISVEPAAVVYHVGGGTLDTDNAQKTFYNFRNSLFNIVKNEQSAYWIIIVLLRMKLDGIAAIRFVLQGRFSHFIAIFRAHLSFYGFFMSTVKKRYKVNNKPQLTEKKAVKSIVYRYFILNQKKFSDF